MNQTKHTPATSVNDRLLMPAECTDLLADLAYAHVHKLEAMLLTGHMGMTVAEIRTTKKRLATAKAALAALPKR